MYKLFERSRIYVSTEKSDMNWTRNQSTEMKVLPLRIKLKQTTQFNQNEMVLSLDYGHRDGRLMDKDEQGKLHYQ